MLQFLPLQADWNPSIQSRYINQKLQLIILSSINAATDIVILALPMPLIWRLHASRSRKIQVSCTFLLGGLWVSNVCRHADNCAHPCWIQCVRSQYITSYIREWDLAEGCKLYVWPNYKTAKVAEERKGATSNGALWSVVETCIAVVSACLPTLPTLITQPANKASARERYEASYKPKRTNNFETINIPLSKVPCSQSIFLGRQEADEERSLRHVSNDIHS